MPASVSAAATGEPAAPTLPLPFGLDPQALGGGGEALRAARAEALARLRGRGLPTTRDEEWRFTSLARLARSMFVRPDPGRRAPTGEAAVAALRLPGAAAELVFVDGILAPHLSRPSATGDVSVASLRDRLAGDGTGLEAQLVRLASERPHAFADLNPAFFAEGAVVEVRPGAVLPAPIHLLFLASGETAPVMALPRTVVLCGPGSEADLVETFAGPGGLTCPVTGVQVGENASLRRYRLQDEADSAFHVSALFARLERSARFSDLSLSLGGVLARHDLHVFFAGEGGEVALDGLFFADGERTSDTHTLIDHAAPHCTSRELYKGVVADKGIGVFRGRVVVRKGAQKTDAAQASRNLLLSREALVHSIPQLEILADDVKCRHGATSGQLDEAALFYLRSRGLSEPAARGLLTVAFAAELLQRIPAPALRERFAASLRRRLPGAAEFREAVL
jgi:Fe-S cluster assembly protein SufD